LTYKYILRLRHIGQNKIVRVEAWPANKKLATPNEIKRPSFIIGSLKGPRTTYVHYIIKDLAKKYGTKKTKTGFKIIFPKNNTNAIIEAYRTGLLLASLSLTKNDKEAENLFHYIEKCTPEEIWFWTSKFLSVIKRDVKPKKVIKALAVLAK